MKLPNTLSFWTNSGNRTEIGSTCSKSEAVGLKSGSLIRVSGIEIVRENNKAPLSEFIYEQTPITYKITLDHNFLSGKKAYTCHYLLKKVSFK